MTRRLSVAERLASTEKDALLNDIAKHSEWDRFLVEQAVLHFGESLTEWSCNDLRDVLPNLGPGFLGAAINSLRSSGVIARVPGAEVPSTSGPTKGHGLKVWRLTDRGRQIAASRRAVRAERRAAA